MGYNVVSPMMDPHQSNHTQSQQFAPLTPQQHVIVRITVFTTVTLSLVSCSFVLYWFMRMRRCFRHDLIVNLIVMDIMKAILQGIFPIMTSIHGDNSLQGTLFCQVGGFALMAVTAAIDHSILMMALHTAMVVLGRGTSNSGLYPIRKYAYCLSAAMCLMMASLVFATPFRYVDVGERCSVATRPEIYRIFLTWLPKYIVFAFVIVIYTGTYIYIRLMIRKYRKKLDSRERAATLFLNTRETVPAPISYGYNSAGQAGTAASMTTKADDSFSQLRPAFQLYRRAGSVDDSRRANIIDVMSDKPRGGSGLSGIGDSKHDSPKWPSHLDIGDRQHPLASNPTISSPCHASADPRDAAGSSWDVKADAMASPPRPAHTSWSKDESCGIGPDSPTEVNSATGLWENPSNSPVTPPKSLVGRRTIITTISMPSALTPPSHRSPMSRELAQSGRARLANRRISRLFSGTSEPYPTGIRRPGNCDSLQLQHLTSPSSAGSRTSYPSPSYNTVETIDSPARQDIDSSRFSSGMTANRDHVIRQLKYLFAYPASYIFAWSGSFISSILLRQKVTPHTRFILFMVSLICLCMQGFVDALLLATRERPWRHAQMGFWEAVCRCIVPSRWNPYQDDVCQPEGNAAGVGKTKDEMLIESRHARLRRDCEIAARKLEMRRAAEVKYNQDVGRSQAVEWWDTRVTTAELRWSELTHATTMLNKDDE